MKYKIRLLCFFFFTLLIAGCATKKNQIFPKKITGTITDCEGERLMSVSIAVLDNEKKVVAFSLSDRDGYYSITVPDKDFIIRYSYIGYNVQEIKVKKQETINVSLRENADQSEIIRVMKPVIYLYPQLETEVSVQVDFAGNFSFTYPQYNQGWNVIASPDGILKNKADNKEYSYLFWDGEFRYEEKDRNYETGFIVHRDSIVSFLQEMLPELGLQSHEYNEFIVFWTPYLKKNEWNFVHFRTGKDYNVISKNIVDPVPDSEIRVFMDFKKVEKPFEINPQEFSTPVRKGFTLVEWGGTELQQEIKVKTKEGKYIIN